MKTAETSSHDPAQPVSVPPATFGDIGQQERHHMIEEAAYYRAEHRAFHGGDPVEDWLAAESEVDEMLGHGETAASPAVKAYRALRQRLKAHLAEIPERVDTAALQHAFERARSEIGAKGAHTTKALGEAADALKLNTLRLAERLRNTELPAEAPGAELLAAWRSRSRTSWDRAVQALHKWAGHGAEQQPVHYAAGQLVEPGVYRCIACGEQLSMEKAGQLKPCPHCNRTEFEHA